MCWMQFCCHSWISLCASVPQFLVLLQRAVDEDESRPWGWELPSLWKREWKVNAPWKLAGSKCDGSVGYQTGDERSMVGAEWHYIICCRDMWSRWPDCLRSSSNLNNYAFWTVHELLMEFMCPFWTLPTLCLQTSSGLYLQKGVLLRKSPVVRGSLWQFFDMYTVGLSQNDARIFKFFKE